MSDPADFSLTSVWQAPGSLERAFTLLTEAERFPDWWGAVYLHVEIVAEGEEDGVGRAARVVTRGALPYRLTFTATAREVVRPHRIVVDATGELNGLGIWSLREENGLVEAKYAWQVNLGGGWKRALAPLLNPLFVWNHNWAMAKGEEGFRRQMAA